MKKLAALCVLTVCSAAALFSCGAPEVPPAPERPHDPDPVIDEDITLTMAVSGGNPYVINGIDLVDEFNKADNGYKIELKDYAEGFDTTAANSDETLSSYNMAIYLDIMKGGQVDIIPNVFSDMGKYHNLAVKGAFADLNEFLDSDDEINRDTLIGNVLRACEINDKLCYMPLAFGIDTMAGPAEYVGSKENWTFDEMKARWEQMPEGSTINWHTSKEYVYFALLRGNLSSFIDYDRAECRFDSDEFINMLDFINTFDDLSNYKPDMDYNAPLFLFHSNITGFGDYHWNVYRQFYENGDDLTYVGYPSSDGCGSVLNIANGAVAISSASSVEKQKGAWEFVRTLFMYENQYHGSLQYNDGFPVNRQAFEDMGRDHYSRENDTNFVDCGYADVNKGYLTKAEYDELWSMIDGIKKVNADIEDDIFAVINDEILYLFKGERTSSQTAANIQNRVQLLVSERS